MCVWNFCSFMYENFTSFIEWASTKFLFHVLLELWIVNFFWFGVYWICTYMCLCVWTCSYELNEKIIIEKVVYMCVNVFYVYFTDRWKCLGMMTATVVRVSMSDACLRGQDHAILTIFLADMEGISPMLCLLFIL